MKSLKEQLLQAGLKATPDVKTVNERQKVEKSKRTEAYNHQQQRNFCEECQQVRPDVELYHHHNPTTEAEWICVKCADRLKIPDSTRQSAQSDTSIKKLFRREHGATKNPNDIKIHAGPKGKGDVNGNR